MPGKKGHPKTNKIAKRPRKVLQQKYAPQRLEQNAECYGKKHGREPDYSNGTSSKLKIT